MERVEMSLPNPFAVFPTIHARRPWVEREALRIAARVRGASLDEVARIARNFWSDSPVPTEIVDADVARTVSYVEQRVRLFRSMTGLRDGGDAA